MADTFYERATGKAVADGIDVQVQLVMTDRALFQADAEPAHLNGYGTIPAQHARDLIRLHPKKTPNTDDPDAADAAGGAIPETGGTAARPGTAFHRPPDPAPAREPDPKQGTVTWSPPNDIQPAPPPGSMVWLRRLYTHPTTGQLQAMDSRARIFPAGMRRMVAARDQDCSNPWCDAPFRHHDHIVPAAAGGPTTLENSQALCERCNYAKEAPGWSVIPVPGIRHTVQTTTPTGHTYTSTAPALPGTPAPGQPSGELIEYRGQRRRTRLLQHLKPRKTA